MTLDELQRMARAVEDDWRRAWVSLGKVNTQPRTVVDDTPELLRICTPGVPETLLNMVMAYSSPGPVSVADVEWVIAPYFTYRLPVQWWLLLGDEPAGLRDVLKQAGMQNWGGATAMAMSLVDSGPPYVPVSRDVELTRVGTDAVGEEALHVIAQV